MFAFAPLDFLCLALAAFRRSDYRYFLVELAILALCRVQPARLRPDLAGQLNFFAI
jgi:hypothetical protein